MLKIDIELVTISHLTIGSGENEFIQSADVVQLKRKHSNKRKICIPASSFKGLLRSSAVEIAHFIINHNIDYCKTVNIDELTQCQIKTKNKGCIICNIFGANDKPSKIYCEDFHPISEKIELQYLTQTRIERNSGKTKKGSLFTKERVPPNISFTASIAAYNLTPDEELILMAALKNLNFCSFGNGNGLINIKIKNITGLSQKNEIIIKLLKSMNYDKGF